MPFDPVFADMVRTFTTTTGTGAVTPGTAVEGHRTFDDALSAGDDFYYSIEGVTDPAEWEVGRGELQGDGTITRDPLASSNGGGPVNFSAGTKTIALTVASEWYGSPVVNGLTVDQPDGAGSSTPTTGIRVDVGNGAGATDIGVRINKDDNSLSGIDLYASNDSGHLVRFIRENPGGGPAAGMIGHINSAGAFYTGAWITVSGQYTDIAPFGQPAHDRTFLDPSVQPFMLGVFADVGLCFQARPNPVETDAYTASFLSRDGRENLAVEENGDLSFLNRHEPSNGEVNPDYLTLRQEAIRFRLGRRGLSTLRVIDGAFGLQAFSEAEVNGTGPDAYEAGPGAMIYVSDAAPGPGTYVSDGFRWAYQAGAVEVDIGWGEPVGSWDFSSTTGAVTFTGLAGYRDLKLEAWGLSHDSASSRLPIVQLSPDDGATWRTTGYESAGINNNSGLNTGSGTFAASVGQAFTAEISNFNAASRKTRAAVQFARVNDATANTFGSVIGRYGTAEAHSALRVVLSGSGNFDAGELRLYGRGVRSVGGGLIGPDSFAWTSQQFLTAGTGAAITETPLKTFEKTAGTVAWNASVLSTETISGDQLIEFIVQSPALLAMVGLTTTAPTVTSGAPAQWPVLTYGAFQSGTSLFGILNGAIGGAVLASGLAIGTRIGIRKQGAVVTLERDRELVGTLTTSAVDAAYRLMVTLNGLGSKVAEVRRRPL